MMAELVKDRKKKLTPRLLRHIEETAEQIKYGRIVIDLNEHLNTVDVTVEVKTRFDKGC